MLHQAALWDNAELLEDLLNGDEIKCLDSRDSWGRTALHAAATNPGSRCLRILAQAGANLDACMGPRGEGMHLFRTDPDNEVRPMSLICSKMLKFTPS